MKICGAERQSAGVTQFDDVVEICLKKNILFPSVSFQTLLNAFESKILSGFLVHYVLKLCFSMV